MNEIKVKKRTTVLDLLPMGSDDDRGEDINRKTLPAGVSSKAVYGDVFALCLPALVELLMVQLASMVDQVMVGQLGSWAISAVGLTAIPKFLLSTAFLSMNVGTMAMVGRYRGMNRPDKANQILRQAFMINTILAVVFAGIGYLFSRPMVVFMAASGQTEQVIAAGTQYLEVQMAGIFTMSICSAIGNAQRGVGDAKTGMMYNTIANILNIFFNWLLIYGKWGFPRLEVLGASIATVAGQFIALIIALWSIRRKNQFIRLEFPKGSFKFEKEPIGDILKIGLPAAVEQIAMRIGIIIFNRTIASLGVVEYACHTICMNIQSLTFMVGMAFSTSSTALVAQSLGKKRKDMAHFYSKRSQSAATYCAVALGIGIFFFAEPLLRLYSKEDSLITMGILLLQMVAFIQPLQSAQFVMAGSLRGAGDTKFTAFITILTAMILRPALGILFVNYMGLGLKGAWYAIIIDQVVRTSLIVWRYRTGKWLNSFRPSSHPGDDIELLAE